MLRSVRGSILAAAAACALGAPAWGAVVTLEAAQDNTLYETADGSLSNGAGEHLFAGRTALGGGAKIRRALVQFDLNGSVPEGSTIDGATLTLHMSSTVVGSKTVSVHRVLKGWGEGTSDAPGEEGAGTRSTPGDATWVHAFFPSEVWAASGGDFAPTPSASTVVDQVGSYNWSSPDLAADVQSWLDSRASNHGWVLVGEETGFPTAKRFDSREHRDPSLRPALVVTYSRPAVPALSALGASVAVLLILGAWCVVWRRGAYPPA